MTARISAVSSVKGGKSRRMIAMELQKGGPGEFWRDFPNRSLNYALATVVSKSTVQHSFKRVCQDAFFSVQSNWMQIKTPVRTLMFGKCEQYSARAQLK